MLKFKKIQIEDADILNEYFSNCDYGICTYSFVALFMNQELNAQYAIENDCLIIKVLFEDKIYFTFPVSKTDDANFDDALLAIETYCIKQNIQLCYISVPESKLQYLVTRYPHCSVQNRRGLQDYVYSVENFANYPGNAYRSKRKFVKRFHRMYPNAQFRELSKDDAPKLNLFFDKVKDSNTNAPDKLEELNDNRDFLKIAATKNLKNLKAYCMELDGEILAIIVFEVFGNMAVFHIQKYLKQYKDLVAVLHQESAKSLEDQVLWINLEEDVDDKGMRYFKILYRPSRMLPKYEIFVNNELSQFAYIQEIQTKNLLLKNIESTNYTIKFDILHKTECLGQLTLCNFNMRGSAELQINIDYDFAKEAILALKDWSLYTMGLQCLHARCNLEDEQVKEILSDCMTKKRADESYQYFEAKS